MRLLEAIPGHRVIIHDFPFAPELEGATGTVIAPHEYSKRFTVQPGYLNIGVELDEPYASRWSRRDVFIKAEHLAHAPSYADLVKELAATREVKDNLTKEVDALGGTITGLRETVRVRDAAINTLKEREDKHLDQITRLQENVQKLRLQNIELETASQPREFKYLVSSETNLYKYYEITVRNGEVVDCTCLGFHFHGHCKHAQHFVIPVEALEYALDEAITAKNSKLHDVLRQVAALTEPYRQ